MKHSRYSFLDGIRGVAAILISIRHTGTYWHFSFYHSYLAVDLFFILSGFVIASAYDKKLEVGVLDLRQFIFTRLIRLYPIFILSLFLSTMLLVLNLSGREQSIDYADLLVLVAMTALFIPSYKTGLTEGGDFLFPLCGPYWSLFFELISNFLYAVFRHWLTNFILCFVVLCSASFLLIASILNGGLEDGYRWGWSSLFTGISRSIFGVSMGLALYRFRDLFRATWDKFPSPWLAFSLITLLLLMPGFGGLNWLFDVVAVLFLFPIAIFVASEGLPSKFEYYLLMLGSISYPFYLLHIPISRLISISIGGNEGFLVPLSGVLLLILISVLSIWLEKNYDIPLRKKLTSYFLRKKA